MQNFYKTILVILVSVLSSQAYSIGYVNRDCPAAGAKESISMDWSQRGEMFYTESMQLAKRGAGRYEWVKFTSGGWQLTWRSYAVIPTANIGQLTNIQFLPQTAQD